MADKPLVTRDLVESILELRSEAERRLMRNKYFVAIRKLDELLEAIQPLEADVIEEGIGSAGALTSGQDRRHEQPQARLAQETPANGNGPGRQRQMQATPLPPMPGQDLGAGHETRRLSEEVSAAAQDDTLTLDASYEQRIEPSLGGDGDADVIEDADERFLRGSADFRG